MQTTRTRRGGESEGQLKKKVVAEYEAPPDSTVVITTSELKAWRNIMDGADREKQRSSDHAGEKAKLMTVANERKMKMIAVDEDRRANGVVKPIEDITEDVTQKETISKAQLKMDEELDEVKYMNKIMLYTKCVTIRDAQIKEKQAIAYEKQEEEKRLDMMMEMERLKALNMYEEREQKRIENRRRGAAVIRAQIEEREQERLRRLELKQQEQEAMLRHIERMKDDDRRENLKKKDAAKRLMEDVALANAEQIRLKNRQREVEQVCNSILYYLESLFTEKENNNENNNRKKTVASQSTFARRTAESKKLLKNTRELKQRRKERLQGYDRYKRRLRTSRQNWTLSEQGAHKKQQSETTEKRRRRLQPGSQQSTQTWHRLDYPRSWKRKQLWLIKRSSKTKTSKELLQYNASGTCKRNQRRKSTESEDSKTQQTSAHRSNKWKNNQRRIDVDS